MSTYTYNKILSKGIEADLPAQVKEGKLRFTTDTRKIFLDTGGERIEFSDFIKGKTESQIKGILAPLPKFYLASDTQKIWYYDSGWKSIEANATTYVDESGHSVNADTATYATNAGTASYSTNSGTATYTVNAGSATSATNASTAQYAVNAGSATNASTANYATNSSTAQYSKNAGTSNYATNASTSDYSTNSGTATYASNAGSATSATNASTANYATNAGSASNAISATNASTAQYAVAAEKATNDGSGNSISGTYAPKASPAFTGTPTTPDVADGDSSGKIANTKFVNTAVTNAVAGITQFDYEVVTSLPTTGVKGKIYLVANSSSTTQNLYDEYIWIGDKYEKLGTTQMDLSNYVNTVTSSGSGNAITGFTKNGNTLTLNKGATFLTGHPAVTHGSSTASATPDAGTNIDVITDITTDNFGHASSFVKTTVTLPKELPNVDSTDNGKILKVVNNQWTKDTNDSAKATYKTLADYEALPSEEKNDPTKIYFVINEGSKATPTLEFDDDKCDASFNETYAWWALNGNPNTSLSLVNGGLGPGENCWWSYHFDTRIQFSKVNFSVLDQGKGLQCYVQGSNDKSTWTNILINPSGYEEIASQVKTKYELPLNCNGVNYEYFRLYFHRTDESGGVHIYGDTEIYASVTSSRPLIYYKNILYTEYELPLVTVEDSGKVLIVSNDGIWNTGDISVDWNNVIDKPTTFAPIIGSASTQAAAGNHNHDTSYWKRTETVNNASTATYAINAGTAAYSADVPSWAKASTKPSYTKSEIGLSNVDNTADANKNVANAVNASTADYAKNGISNITRNGLNFTVTKADGSTFGFDQQDMNTTYTKSSLGLGNVANLDQSKAIKTITRSGLTFTATALDGSTSSFTQQDTNTTYANMTSAAAGLAPAGGSGTTKYLRQDGSWQVPPDNNTTYGNVSTAANGLAPKVTNTAGYLKGDGTWGTPGDTTYSLVSTADNGLAPKITNTSGYLKGDGTWAVPPNTTYANFTSAAAGLAPASGGGTTKYLRADGSWQVPPDNNTTYDLSPYAPKASPAFTGTPTAPDVATGDNSTKIANTKFVTSAITTAIAGVTQFDYEVVTTLPTTGVKGKIYLVVNGSSTTQNIYDEYIWIGDKYEKLGTTQIDLSNYINTVEISGSGNAVTTFTKSGNTLTLTKGTTFPTTNTTYANVTTAAAGLAPKVTSTSGFLKGDGTWATPTNTTYANFTSAAAGLAPASGGGTTKYLRADGSWQVPPDNNTTYGNVSTAAAGLAPKVTSTSGFLKGDGTWATPTNTTYANVTSATAGLAPAGGSGTTKYLRQDGSWQVPPDTNTTYANMTSAAAGLAPAGGSGTTKYLRQDGSWQVPPDTNTTYAVATTAANGLMASGDKTNLNSAIKNITRSGVTFTATKVDGGTFTFTQQDSNTTYPANTWATSAANGTSGLFNTTPPKDGYNTKFLRADGSWVVPTNTTYANFTSVAAGLTPSSGGGTTKYLRADGSWQVPPDTNTTYANMTSAAAGLAPAGGSGTTKYLRQDGSWQVPPDTNTWRPVGTGASDAAAGNHTHGISIATDSGTNQLTMAASTKYKLTAGGQSYIFTTPPNNTYNFTGTTFKSNTTGAIALNSSTVNQVGYTNGTSAIYGQNDGALYAQAYSGSWVGQIYQDYRSGHIAVRSNNNGTWTDWGRVFDTRNVSGSGGITVNSTTAGITIGVGTVANSTNAATATYASSAGAVAWGNVSGKPSTFAPIIGTGSTQAAAGNHNHDGVYLKSVPSQYATTATYTAGTGLSKSGTAFSINANASTCTTAFYPAVNADFDFGELSGTAANAETYSH